MWYRYYIITWMDFITSDISCGIVFDRYLDEALNNVSFGDTDPAQQIKLDRLLSYGLASELQCLRYGLRCTDTRSAH